jgi:hypothetical protein
MRYTVNVSVWDIVDYKPSGKARGVEVELDAKNDPEARAVAVNLAQEHVARKFGARERRASVTSSIEVIYAGLKSRRNAKTDEGTSVRVVWAGE